MNQLPQLRQESEWKARRWCGSGLQAQGSGHDLQLSSVHSSTFLVEPEGTPG